VKRVYLTLLNGSTAILFTVALAVFGALSPKFFSAANLQNLLVQSSSTGVVAIGMTFVLLTAGVDLSVGAIIFVAAAIAGKMLLAGIAFPFALLAILAAGVAFGALNAVLITRFGIVAFIATLGTLYAGRGLGLWITQTRAMNLPARFLQIGMAHVLGVPLPVVVFVVVLVVGHVTLARTPYGRQLYAVGYNLESAKKAGVNTRRLLASVYIISGICAVIGCILSLAQLGAVSPTFGANREFAAIAAAVLGGASLFGGRGTVFPGTVLGVLLIQSVENGLVILNADPYLYPLVTSAIIFLAVLIDSTRSELVARLRQRMIFHEGAA
jgi:ribose transport system permease protein